MTKDNERKELLWRILIAIITGIILNFWKMVIFVVTIINWAIVLFTGKRNKDLADFCEIWNTQLYRYAKYLTMVDNERVFPFEALGNNISKFKR